MYGAKVYQDIDTKHFQECEIFDKEYTSNVKLCCTKVIKGKCQRKSSQGNKRTLVWCLSNGYHIHMTHNLYIVFTCLIQCQLY